MRRKRLTVFLLLFMLALPAWSQEKKVIWTRLAEAAQLALDGASDSAMVIAERTLPMAAAQDEKLAEILLLEIIGTSQREQGDDPKALNTYRQSEKLISQLSHDDYETIRNSSHLINLYTNLAELCNDLKKKEEACRYARKAAQEADKNTDKVLRGIAFPQIGGILLECGHLDEAEHWLRLGYQEALRADLPGNALVAASHMMIVEDQTRHPNPKQNNWKAKADLLLPKVSSDYPLSIYYTAVSHISLQAGELTAVHEAQEKALQLEGIKKQITPEKTKEFLKQVEEEQAEAYTRHHQQRIKIITGILIGLLMVFACYILWQQRRRKKAQEKADQQMEEQFIEGLETERSRMARELHDGVSNQLLAIEMKLASDGLTEQTRQMLTESRERIRQVSHELMPPEFQHNSIDEVLNHYICSIDGAQGCEMTYQSQPEEASWDDIPPSTAFEVYRIVQEAIGNALKHSEATLIAVGMKREGNHVTLTVADNGKGSQGGTASGIGSRTLQQRTKVIHGTLNTQSTHFGTVLQLSFPLV